MPVMDGTTAARAIIAALGANAPPICALTASCSEAEKARCLAAGFTAHLSKPMRMAQLSELRELVLAAQAQRRAAAAAAAEEDRSGTAAKE